MKYPIKAEFYTSEVSLNSYQEKEEQYTASFSTGVRAVQSSFKDVYAKGQKLEGHKLYLYTRKNQNTMAIKVNQYLKLPNLTDCWYKVIGVDPVYNNRHEIVFYVDLIEKDAVVIDENGNVI